MTSAAVGLGYGKHIWDMDTSVFPRLVLVSNVAGTFSILAALWSKTSFAMTVLRISTGWMRWAIWFIIMSLTVIMGASAMFEWVKCTPVEKNWNGEIPGTCWPTQVVIYYYSFSSGKLRVGGAETLPPSLPEALVLICVCPVHSILGRNGHYSGVIPLEDYLGDDDEQAREDRRVIRHEHGRLVRLAHAGGLESSVRANRCL